jgi:extracellular factor (EF) 3-hydroxypalmitic acid methyl ester biosynthesis protein
MHAQIDAFLDTVVAQFTRELAEIERQIGAQADPDIAEGCQKVADAFQRATDACRLFEDQHRPEADLLKETKRRHLAATAPWIEQSWFMERARKKPRGYPGDHELLSAIYDHRPKSRGLGECLDRYFLASTLGRGVCERLQCARQFLIEEISGRRGDVAVLNVACGPCREYRGGLPQPAQGQLRITCLDADQQALDAALAGAPRGMNIRGLCYNALRMGSSKRNIEKFGRSDIIYSVGLCDYIPDNFLVAMLRGWRESLHDGGVVYVAFKDCRRYDHTPYQWHVDWYFFQRTEEQCRSLFEQAGYDMNAIQMTRDDTGAIINFISRAKTPAVFRIDPAGQPGAAPAHAPQNSATPVE